MEVAFGLCIWIGSCRSELGPGGRCRLKTGYRSGAEAEVKDAARLDLLGQERKVM